MLQDNELKSVFVDFCKQKREMYKLNEESYFKLLKETLNIYENLISDDEYVYLNIVSRMLSFELYDHVLFLACSEGSEIYKRYSSHFWRYSVHQGVISQQDIYNCIDLGIEFDYEQQDDYFYDQDSDIYCDTIFKNKGSKEKQYYLIQKSNKINRI